MDGLIYSMDPSVLNDQVVVNAANIMVDHPFDFLVLLMGPKKRMCNTFEGRFVIFLRLSIYQVKPVIAPVQIWVKY